MTRTSLVAFALFLLVALAIPAQMRDDGSWLQPRPPAAVDDPPGTKLKEFNLPTPRMHGLTTIGDRFYGCYQTSSTQTDIYELDPNTGGIKATIALSGYATGGWPYGLGYDLRRNEFVLSDTGGNTRGIYRADITGRITTYVQTPGEGNVGAAYDPHRDGYWICAWNLNTLKLYDAKNLPAVLMTIDLAAVSCTSSAGVAFSAINDVVYVNSRGTGKGFVFDAGTGKLLLSYSGVSSGYGSMWLDRWQCPVVVEEGLKKITFKDAGYPRVDATNRVQVGKTLAINWKAGSSPSKYYKGAAALAERMAGIRFGNRYLPLQLDGLFFASIQLPTVFRNFEGVLDTSGMATGAVNVPNVPALAGFPFSIAWVTVDAGAPYGIQAISGPWKVGITK
jgi:hypothetical protein